MNLGLRILRTATITLAVLVGLPVLWFFWSNNQWIRQDIRVDTGEIREVHEGVLWDSSPENIHETSVTPVLKKYGIGMMAQGDPWVFFDRNHAHLTKGGDYHFERHVFGPEPNYPGRTPQIYYGDFLEAMVKYRGKEQAALWWQFLIKSGGESYGNRFYRSSDQGVILWLEKPWASQAEFNVWWKWFMESGTYQRACESFPGIKEAP